MKYDDSQNKRSNKYRKYRFSDHEIGVIALAVQDRINYLSGLLMLHQDAPGNRDDLYAQLGDAQKIQKLIGK
jgi:hypothetical protein